MHKMQSSTAFGLIVSILLPSLAYANVQASTLRASTTNAIDQARNVALEKEKELPDIFERQQQAELQFGLSLAKMQRLQRAKRAVRLDIAAHEKLIDSLQEEFGLDATDELSLLFALEAQRRQLRVLARRVARIRNQLATSDNSFASSLSSHALGLHPGKRYEQKMRLHALTKTRAEVYRKVDMIRGMPKVVASLRDDHQEMLHSFDEQWALHAAAKETLSASDDQVDEIRRIVREVELQVELLQSKLDDYDRRLCDAAEKQLILKGLKSGKDRKCGAVAFIWPVPSRYITAGYLDHGYHRYFGVPHKAIDVRAAQGTDVRASANGIVYKVHDGGRYGYSYILIGHRNGFATLYGHMSSMRVSEGQEVAQGQVIGLSGGTPGTNGAGPMTTGPHMHFEVIQDGEHIDPMLVLPFFEDL